MITVIGMDVLPTPRHERGERHHCFVCDGPVTLGEAIAQVWTREPGSYVEVFGYVGICCAGRYLNARTEQ